MFKGVINISSLSDRKLYIEKINILIRIVKLSFELEKLNYSKNKKDINSSVINELIAFKIIEVEDHIEDLKKIIKTDIFETLIVSINNLVDHKKIIKPYLANIDISQRSKVQKEEQIKKKPKVVDLFCGAGGLSLGFKNAGFKLELAVDNDIHCIETFRYNHPEVEDNRIFNSDIREIENKIRDLGSENIDVVCGGPPCQGFSSANQQRIIDDPRNNLYKYFIKVVNIIKPKFILMENVRGMIPFAEQIKDDFKNISFNSEGLYDISYKILVSDDYGVSQKRQRIFFIGIRKDISDKIKINSDDIFNEILKNQEGKNKFVLNDAISFIKPLKAPKQKNMTNTFDNITGGKIMLNDFSGNENKYLKNINSNKMIPFMFNHKARYVNEINYKIYSRLNEGDDGSDEKISDIMPYKNRKNIFKDKYYKLKSDKPSRTITAHLKMDSHSHIHPFQVRSITPREAARIQSFPDNYFFIGPYLKTYMQIGNAVPPNMAKEIAFVLKKYAKLS
jgi:DNA (cytosine-5)-methyltransferase 1